MTWRRLLIWRPHAWLASRRGWPVWLVLFMAGALSALSMAPLHVWPALMLGLCALLWGLDGVRHAPRPLRAGFVRGLVFGLGYFMAGTFWIAFAFVTRGAGYAVMAPFVVPVFAAMLAVFWGLAGAAYIALGARSVWRIFAFAAVITALEWVRGHLFGGLPWNLPAYTWRAGGIISQAASWFGVYGLTFLTVFVLSAPAVAAGSLRMRRLMPLMVSAAIGLILVCTGALRLGAMPAGVQPDVRIRLVQSALSQREKWAPDGVRLTRDRYLALTGRAGLDEVTHIVWPEGALPSFMLEDGPTLGLIASQLRSGQVLLAGVNRRAVREDGDGYTYHNALAVMRFDGVSPRIDALYDKVRLTPFGEMVPMTGLLRLIGLDAFTRYQFTPGPGASVLDVPGAPPMLPLICYEAIFPGFQRSAEGRPAWLLNISNDAWFGTTAGPQQHFNQARYRSIEAGLPMVRAASRGVSGVVDAAGRTRERIPPQAEGVYDVDLPLPVAAPPYMSWGDWPVAVLVLLVIAGALLRRRLARGDSFMAHP